MRAAFVALPLGFLVVSCATLMMPLYSFNLTAIVTLVVAATFKLILVAVRPLLEEGRQLIEWFDISDARLFWPRHQ